MKRVISAAAVGLALLCANQASAATYIVTLKGTLTSQNGPGSDPNFSVGDVMTMTARFESDRVVEWGSYGHSTAGLYGLETFGATFVKFEMAGKVWSSYNETYDGGDPFYTSYRYLELSTGEVAESRALAAPAIMFANGKVLGVAGELLPAHTNQIPVLHLGSFTGRGHEESYTDYLDGPATHYAEFTPANFRPEFGISAGNDDYGNTYETPGFSGTWDYANSSVVILSGVP